jgi:hypothetical protein
VLGVIQENPFVAKAFAEKVGTDLPLLSKIACSPDFSDSPSHIAS